MKIIEHITPTRAAAAILVLFGTLASTAAPVTSASEAQALFRSEMAACTSGASQQSRQVCVQEAKAAHAQNLRGGLADRNPSYERNNAQRCDALAGAEKLACTQRMQGAGTTSGSAATGGIYRELVTRSDEAPKPTKAD